jgi:hypothetical protein
MRTDHFDPYTVGECIAAQTIKLAYCLRESQPVDPASAAIIKNVVTSAQSALAAGGECLKAGDVEAALYALGVADGAMRLIAGLLAAPEDAIVKEMATPFIPTGAEVRNEQ